MSEVAQLRVGVPKPGGELLEHAKAMGYPILLSANSLVLDAPPRALIESWESKPPHTSMNDRQRRAWAKATPPRDFRG